ncbi:hypothetical protein PQX77_004341 [Marasmius sp. AFHP31]|nr:hypothetical protein PQX77_004341 [Marasmius sp. AFHP31]
MSSQATEYFSDHELEFYLQVPTDSQILRGSTNCGEVKQFYVSTHRTHSIPGDIDDNDDSMKIDDPPAKKESARPAPRPTGATRDHTCGKAPTGVSSNHRCGGGGETGKGKIKRLVLEIPKPLTPKVSSVNASCENYVHRHCSAFVDILSKGSNDLSPIKQAKGKEREIVIDQHSPRVPEPSPRPPTISAPSRMRDEEGMYFIPHVSRVSEYGTLPSLSTSNEDTPECSITNGATVSVSKHPYQRSSHAQNYIVDAFQYPDAIPIESDSDDPNEDAEITFATDSSFVSTQERSFDPVPDSKGTSLNSIGSVNSPSTRKRAPSPTRDSPRANKSPRTPANRSPISRPLALEPSSRAPEVVVCKQSNPQHSFNSLLERAWKTPMLSPHVIAHFPELQPLFDDPGRGVGWGVQWTLARGVKRGDWTVSDIRNKIDRLSGPDGEKLHLVSSIMRERDSKSLDNTIGKELDREQAAIVENKGRGLGLMGEWRGAENWYGGRVQFVATLEQARDKKYELHLEPIEMKRSNRYSRLLGSRRMLQIRLQVNLHTPEDKDALIAFLSKSFVLNGRIFLPIPPKDNVLYAIEVNADYGRESQAKLGDHFRWTLGQFLDWHNSIEGNDNQAVAKFFTRIALGLSVSVPALEFEPDRILYIDDEVAPDCSVCSKDKPPAEKVLTDGCGYINRAALAAIAKYLGFSKIPAAVQGRIAGAKGLWMLKPDDEDPIPTIWIRHSQNKINCRTLDRAHCIFELLSTSRPSSTISLSQQSVVNLWFNGVEDDTLIKLMEDGLKELVESLTSWGKEATDMPRLWDTINQLNGVTTSRVSKVAASKSRAVGITGREFSSNKSSFYGDSSGKAGEASNKADSGIEESNGSRDPHSGLPKAWAEVAMEMLQSGFFPCENRYLADKIKYLLKSAVEKYVEKCHIPLSEGHGFDCLVVPDPFGILAPDEIYYRSSEGFVNPETLLTESVLTGEVLIGRYPVRLPSDIQKVKAVDKPELGKWQDVIVVPIQPISDKHKGLMSFMSILGGGDLDGDNAFVIRHPELVPSFNKKPLTLPPANLDENFQSEKKRTTAFARDIRHLIDNNNVVDAQREFYRVALSGFTDSKVGIYSGWHDNAAAAHGYDSPQAIRLAHIFTALLDGGKTGVLLKSGIKKQDDDADRKIKDRPSPGFILTRLRKFGNRLSNDALAQYDRKIDQLSKKPSPDDPLLLPMRTVEALITQAKADLDALVHEECLCKVEGNQPSTCDRCKKQIIAQAKYGHLRGDFERVKRRVDEIFSQWIASFSKSSPSNEPTSPSKRARDRAKIQASKSSVTYNFQQPIPSQSDFFPEDAVKVAYAYSKSLAFGFDVAFQSLTHLKATTCHGGAVSSTRTFDGLRNMGGAARKLF